MLNSIEIIELASKGGLWGIVLLFCRMCPALCVSIGLDGHQLDLRI